MIALRQEASTANFAKQIATIEAHAANITSIRNAIVQWKENTADDSIRPEELSLIFNILFSFDLNLTAGDNAFYNESNEIFSTLSSSFEALQNTSDIVDPVLRDAAFERLYTALVADVANAGSELNLLKSNIEQKRNSAGRENTFIQYVLIVLICFSLVFMLIYGFYPVKKSLSNLSEKVRELIASNATLEATIASISQKLGIRQTQLKQTVHKLSVNQTKIASLENERLEMAGHLETIAEEKLEIEKQLVEKSSELESLLNEQEKLLHHAQTLNEQVREKEVFIAQMEEKYQENQAVLDRKKLELEEISQAMEAQREEYGTFNERYDALNNKAISLETECGNLSDQLEKAKKEIENSHGSSKEIDEKIDTLNHEIEEYKKIIQKAREENSKLVGQMVKKDNELDLSKKLVRQREEEMDSMSIETQDAREKSKRLGLLLEKKEQNYNALSADVKQKEELIKSLQLEKDDLLEANKRLHLDTRKKAEELRDQSVLMDEKLAEIEKLRQLEDSIIALQAEKRAMEASREEARDEMLRFEMVLKNGNDAIWDMNLENDHFFLSPVWYKMFGYDPSNLEGRLDEILYMVHVDDRKGLQESFEKCKEGLEPEFHNECRVQHYEGHFFWVVMKGKAQKDESGQVERIIGVTSDISKQKETEESLQALSEIAENIVSSVLILDNKSLITWANKVFLEQTGYDLDEVKGNQPESLLCGDESSLIDIDEMRIGFESGKSFQQRILYYKKNGSPYQATAWVTPYFDAAGKIEKYIIFHRDIEEGKPDVSTEL
ncbi:MAG: PAS domain S-box protein [Cyclobacteriaceae bacterium]|nr:PAS domain S-box protein [Cyclobacteriaceae bacterium]